MQIIVTGGTGTLGKAVIAALIAALIAADHNTISLVRMPDTEAQEEVTQVAVDDLSDPQATREAFARAHAALGRIDAVIHLAGSGESDLVEAIRESTQRNALRAGDQLTSRNLDIQPTITIRPGMPIRLLVSRDLILAPWRDTRGGK